MYPRLIFLIFLLLSIPAYSDESILLKAEYLILGQNTPAINNLKLMQKEADASAKFIFTVLSFDRKYREEFKNGKQRRFFTEEILIAAEAGLPQAISYVHSRKYQYAIREAYPEFRARVELILAQKNGPIATHPYVHVNTDTVHTELDKLVTAGNTQAMYLKGMALSLGLYIDEDAKAGWNLLQQATELGNGNSACQLSENVRLIRNYQTLSEEKKNEYFRIAIGDDEPHCNYLYGNGYYHNYSKIEDRVPAFPFLQAAAEAGHVDAMFRLAQHYISTGKDFEKYINAIEWLDKADYLKHPNAWTFILRTYSEVPAKNVDISGLMERYIAENQNERVALMFEKGMGVNQDYHLAHQYYLRANKNTEARRILRLMPPVEVSDKSDNSTDIEKPFPLLQMMFVGVVSILAIYSVFRDKDSNPEKDKYKRNKEEQVVIEQPVELEVDVNNSRGRQLHNVMTIQIAKKEIEKGNYEEAKLILSEYLRDIPLDDEAQKLFEIAVKWS